MQMRKLQYIQYITVVYTTFKTRNTHCASRYNTTNAVIKVKHTVNIQ